MTPVTVKGARLHLSAEPSPEPVGSRLDPVIEWAEANPWKTAIIVCLFAYSAPGIVERFL